MEVNTYNASSLIKNNILEIGDGYRAKNSELRDVGLPFARAGNIKNGFQFDDADILANESVVKAGRKTSLPGDVVFTSKGTVGRFALVSESTPKFVYSPQICYWRVQDTTVINSAYLFYWMQSQEFLRQVHKVKGLTDMADYVSLSDQRKMNLTLPNLDVQKQIAACLRSYDDLIENNNRRIAILEEMAQSLYREWFVKFRFPGHELCQMVESPLGLIPEGWRSSPLGELVHFKRNSVKKGKLENPTPYMGLEHFPRKSFALSEWDVTTEIGSSKLAFEKGDILFGKIRPYFHKVGVAQINGLCSSDTFVLSARDSKYSNLIAMVTFSESFVAHAVQTSQGTKMPRANWDVLSEYYVALAPDGLLSKFNGIAGPAIEQVRVLGAKNRNLKKQRDLLLPKLISGQIDLSQAEQASA